MLSGHVMCGRTEFTRKKTSFKVAFIVFISRMLLFPKLLGCKFEMSVSGIFCRKPENLMVNTADVLKMSIHIFALRTSNFFGQYQLFDSPSSKVTLYCLNRKLGLVVKLLNNVTSCKLASIKYRCFSLPI